MHRDNNFCLKCGRSSRTTIKCVCGCEMLPLSHKMRVPKRKDKLIKKFVLFLKKFNPWYKREIEELENNNA